MPVARQRLLLSCLALACGMLAGCGKSAELPSGGGPTRTVAPLSVQGAVSVSTRNTTRLGGADAATDAASVARAVYPGLTTATRPQVVMLVNQDNWPAALAAAALASAPTGAPILFSEGDKLPEVSGQTLEAMRPLGSSALGGVQVVSVDTTATVPHGLLARALDIPPAEATAPTTTAGSSASGSATSTAGAGSAAAAAHGAGQAAATNAAANTAAAIERLLLSADGSSPPHDVIIVPANAQPALAAPAAGLAAESGAPILFVGPAHVPKATATALASLHRPSIFVVDPAQLSSATLAGLRHFGTVTTIAAPVAASASEPAAANAIAVARFTNGDFGWGVKEPGHGLVFANAARPLDGPGSALLSATANYGPLLLLESATRVPTTLAAYLGDIQPAYNSAPEFRPDKGVYNHGWLIGAETAISAVTQSELDALLEISPSRQGAEEPSISQVE
jgi:ell wall binding domain 2 (CWB2)